MVDSEDLFERKHIRPSKKNMNITTFDRVDDAITKINQNKLCDGIIVKHQTINSLIGRVDKNTLPCHRIFFVVARSRHLESQASSFENEQRQQNL